MLTQTFTTPQYHPKSKAFYDHVYSFLLSEGNLITFRHYQVNYEKTEKQLQHLELIEIGPRFALEPIKIFDGFMGGKTIYANPLYVSANQIRQERKRQF